MLDFSSLIISSFNEFELICITIVSTLLHDFSYCYQILIILFNINPLFSHNKVVTSIAI